MASWTIQATGGKWGFVTAFGVVAAWAISGPIFRYSDDWQLVINTGTTIVTFLMVFLIQNAQNRESKAVHLKLDELIRAVKNASNEMIDIEHLNEDQLDFLAERYHALARAHIACPAPQKPDTPQVEGSSNSHPSRHRSHISLANDAGSN
jgi:low affinity Fe/Cu permease